MVELMKVVMTLLKDIVELMKFVTTLLKDIVELRKFVMTLDIVELRKFVMTLLKDIGWRCGLMVSVLDSGVSGLGSIPGQGHRVVFLGKTLYSHSASLHPGV